MAKIKTFRVMGAEAFDNVSINLDKRGLVRMKGKNGEGKSSFWYLLTQLYFRKNPNKNTKSDLMTDAGKDFLLESYFESNGILYCVAEAVKSKEISPNGEKYASGYFLYKQSEDGSWIDISEHKDLDTAKKVQSLIGWSNDEWFGYVFLTQQTSHKLIMGTKSDRQTYLSALYNLGGLDKLAAHYKAKAEDLADVVAALDEKKQQITFLQSSLESFGDVDAIRNESLDREAEAKELSEIREGLYAQQAGFDELNFLNRQLAEADAPQNMTVESINESLQKAFELQASRKALEEQARMVTTKLNTLDVKLKASAAGTLPADFETVIAYPDVDAVSLTAQISKAKTETANMGAEPAKAGTTYNSEELAKFAAYPNDENIDQLQKEIDTIKARPDFPDCHRPLQEEFTHVREAISDIKGIIGTTKNEIKKLTFSEPECDKCGSTLDCADRTAVKATKEQELLQLEENLKVFQEELVCMERDEKLWADYDKLGPDRRSEIPSMQDRLDMARSKRHARAYLDNEVLISVWKQKDEVRKSIPDMEARLTNYNKKVSYLKLKESIAAAEGIRFQHNETKAELEQIETNLKNMADVSGEITTLKSNLEKLRSVQALESAIAQLIAKEEAVGGYEDVAAEIEMMSTRITECQDKIAQNRQRLQDIEKTDTKMRALMLEVSEQQDTYREQKKCELLQKAYGKAGKLRQLQLAKFSGYLEKALLAHTYKQLPKHRFKIVVDDGIEIMASKEGGRFYDVSTMSGGEKGALSVAFLFALDDMLQPSRRTNLKIVDEAEGAFDEGRKNDFIEHTLPELKKRAETVIVISHQSISDQGVFDRVWEVKNRDIKDVSGEIREAM